MDLTIASTIALMILYVYTKNRILGCLAWISFAIASVIRIPYFLELNDYYNTVVFSLAFVFFSIMSYSILRRNSKTFVEVTTFSVLSCLAYFPFEFIEILKTYIVNATARLTAILGNLMGFPMRFEGAIVYIDDCRIEIILACTAIESIALFTGATLGVNADLNKRIKAFLVSVPVIYVLNLFRNVFVIVSTAYAWFGVDSFYVAHHVLAKVFSTIALVFIALAVFKLLPELYELIHALKDEIVMSLELDYNER